MSESQERKPRKRLAPSEKYEMFVQILTQQATQREAAASWGVDRTTVVHVCRVAKDGALAALATSVPGRRPGSSPERVELDAARARPAPGPRRPGPAIPRRGRAAAAGAGQGRGAARCGAPGRGAVGVDIASLHEYDQGEIESNHGPGARANSAGKPVIVGEFGIEANNTGAG